MSDTWSEHYAVQGRRAGKRAWTIEMCALQEFLGNRWEIVGGTPERRRETRRLARERAAQMSDLIDGPTETP